MLWQAGGIVFADVDNLDILPYKDSTHIRCHQTIDILYAPHLACMVHQFILICRDTQKLADLLGVLNIVDTIESVC
jgi:hypothetical protein